MFQNAHPLRKSAPSHPNISDEHVSCTAPAKRNAFCQILCICPMPAIGFEIATKPSRFTHFWQGAQSRAPAMWDDIGTPKSGTNMCCFLHFDFEMCFAPQRRPLFRHHNFQKWSERGVFCAFWLGDVLRATTASTFSTSQLPNALRHWGVLYILTSKCASRHNGVHFFDITTSKCASTLWCFVHFDFQICFAPQRRALFRHLNFQKWSEHGALCTFWLPNVLRAKTACTFSTSQLPKAIRTCTFWLPNVLLATTVCKFHLSSDLIALHPPLERAYFSTLRCHKSLEKHSVSRLSYLFAHLHLLSSDSFSFSDSSHLCFSICPYCRKFDF